MMPIPPLALLRQPPRQIFHRRGRRREDIVGAAAISLAQAGMQILLVSTTPLPTSMRFRARI